MSDKSNLVPPTKASPVSSAALHGREAHRPATTGRSRLATVLLALFASAGFPACVSSRVEISKEPPLRQRQWGMLCKDAAMLSAVVYRNRASKPDLKGEPLRCFLQRLSSEGWVHRGTCDRTQGVGEGLCFEVWENRRGPQRRIIIAFRGTQSLRDWGANFRAFRGLHPLDHYAIAPEECLPIIDRLRAESPSNPPLIISTGHSLGGGLAQELLYVASDKVDHCLAFDSSPVTAFHNLSQPLQCQYMALGNRELFSQYRIIRAYHKGEILSPIRDALQVFYKPDTLTRAVEFKSARQPVGPIGKHSMNLLAQTILEHADLTVKSGEHAKYDYHDLHGSAYVPVAPAFRPFPPAKRAKATN